MKVGTGENYLENLKKSYEQSKRKVTALRSNEKLKNGPGSARKLPTNSLVGSVANGLYSRTNMEKKTVKSNFGSKERLGIG